MLCLVAENVQKRLDRNLAQTVGIETNNRLTARKKPELGLVENRILGVRVKTPPYSIAFTLTP